MCVCICAISHDSSVGKTVGLTIATYLCRTGSNCACGMLAKILSGEKYQYKEWFDCHLPGCSGFTEYCPGFPPAEDSRPKCVFKSLELLDLIAQFHVMPAHMCFTHNNKSIQSDKSNINHFKLCVSLFKNTTSLMILEKP